MYILFRPWRVRFSFSPCCSLSRFTYPSLFSYRRTANRSWAALNHPFLITISNGPRLTRINYLRWQYPASGADWGAVPPPLLNVRSNDEEKNPPRGTFARYPDIEKISANSAATTSAAKEARINPWRIKSIAMLVGN